MTTQLEPPAVRTPVAGPDRTPGGQHRVQEYAAPQGISGALRRQWGSLAIIAALVVICVVATSHNIANNPIRFKDEGVYIAQAWAIPNLHTLANYTYWYDHPPLGWMQISLWATLTDGWDRWHDNTTMVGREFMVVVRAVNCALIFVLARRLGMRRSWATVASLLFIFSPLAMYYGRLALLDNIATMWVLASFVLAMSPKKAWIAAVGSALCFAVSINTKETLALLLPALIWALWINYRRSTNRPYVWVSFVLVLGLCAALYPLYAAIKSELIPGDGHVSLIGGIEWQLGSRKGSGSVFDTNSDARTLVDSWLGLDRWLPIGGVVAGVLLLGRRVYRPIVLVLVIQLAMMLRNGYLPSMYVISMLPFMALTLAGLCDWWWPAVRSRVGAVASGPGGRRPTVVGQGMASSVAAVAGLAVVSVFWSVALANARTEGLYKLSYQWNVDADKSERETVAWIRDNVPHDSVLVAEGELWLDLNNVGFSQRDNIWVYKVDSDPAVSKLLDYKWQSIDYLALSTVTLISESKYTMPIVFEALAHADKIAEFGQGDDAVNIFKVRKE